MTCITKLIAVRNFHHSALKLCSFFLFDEQICCILGELVVFIYVFSLADVIGTFVCALSCVKFDVSR